jgi:hypothetical protein
MTSTITEGLGALFWQPYNARISAGDFGMAGGGAVQAAALVAVGLSAFVCPEGEALMARTTSPMPEGIFLPVVADLALLLQVLKACKMRSAHARHLQGSPPKAVAAAFVSTVTLTLGVAPASPKSKSLKAPANSGSSWKLQSDSHKARGQEPKTSLRQASALRLQAATAIGDPFGAIAQPGVEGRAGPGQAGRIEPPESQAGGASCAGALSEPALPPPLSSRLPLTLPPPSR